MPKKKMKAVATKSAFKYRQRFGLIIEQSSEREQKREFQKLRRLGYSPRVVVV